MVKKQPISLFKQCVKMLSGKIWKFSYKHIKSCKLCTDYKDVICSDIQPVKDMFDLIPHNIIDNIYLQFKSDFNLYARIRNTETYVLYLALSLLGVEHTSILNIKEFPFVVKSDIFFVLKFGNNINEICFGKHHDVIFGNSNVFLWRTLLRNLKNIQALDLHNVEFTDEFLEVIGQECHQLKILKGLEYHKEIAGVKPKYCITSKSFMRILYSNKSNGKIANKCCESLKEIPISVYGNCNTKRGKELYLKMNKIITTITENVPNIKTLRCGLDFDVFLESIDNISETRLNLEVISIDKLTDKLVSVLKVSCPRVRKLRCSECSNSALQELHSFQLEELTLRDFYVSETLLYSEIVSLEWSTLKILHIHRKTIITGEVNIDVLIKQLPLIVDLELHLSGEIKWSRTTYFKHLERVTFRLANCNVSWFLSFSNTIKHIDVSCSNDYTFDRNTCKLFLDSPFLCLEYLRVCPFSYDFLFNTSVLTTIPNLKNCSMFSSDYKLARAEEIELSQFLKANNMYCVLR